MFEKLQPPTMNLKFWPVQKCWAWRRPALRLDWPKLISSCRSCGQYDCSRQHRCGLGGRCKQRLCQDVLSVAQSLLHFLSILRLRFQLQDAFQIDVFNKSICLQDNDHKPPAGFCKLTFLALSLRNDTAWSFALGCLANACILKHEYILDMFFWTSANDCCLNNTSINPINYRCPFQAFVIIGTHYDV